VVGETSVNRAAMATAAGQVETTVAEVRSLQSTLDGVHESLMGGWQGEAATAFTNAFTRFNSDFTIVINALQSIHDGLVGTHKSYTAVETTNTAASSRISSQLNR